MKMRNIILPMLLLGSLMLFGCAYEGSYGWGEGYPYAPYGYYGDYGPFGDSPFYYGGEGGYEHHEFRRGYHGFSHGMSRDHNEFHGHSGGERGEGHEFHGGGHEDHDFH